MQDKMNVKYLQTTVTEQTYTLFFEKCRQLKLKGTEGLRQAISKWLEEGEEKHE